MTPYELGQLTAMQKQAGLGADIAWESSKLIPVLGALPSGYDAFKHFATGRWGAGLADLGFAGLSLISPFTGGATTAAATAAKAGRLGATAAKVGKLGATAAKAGKLGATAAKAGKIGATAAKVGKLGAKATNAVGKLTNATTRPIKYLENVRGAYTAKALNSSGIGGKAVRAANKIFDVTGGVTGRAARSIGKLPGIRSTKTGTKLYRYGNKRLNINNAYLRNSTGRNTILTGASFFTGDNPQAMQQAGPRQYMTGPQQYGHMASGQSQNYYPYLM